MFKPKDSKFLEYYTKYIYKKNITDLTKFSRLTDIYFFFYEIHITYFNKVYNDVFFLKVFEVFYNEIKGYLNITDEEEEHFIKAQIIERVNSTLIESKRIITEIDEKIQIYIQASEQSEFPLTNHILLETIEFLEKLKYGQQYDFDEKNFPKIFDNTLQSIRKNVEDFYNSYEDFFTIDNDAFQDYLDNIEHKLILSVKHETFVRELKKAGEKQFAYSFLLDDHIDEEKKIFTNFTKIAAKAVIIDLIFKHFNESKSKEDHCISDIYR